MSDTEEIAKAVQEVAKLGSSGIETANKMGGFFTRVFKGPVDEVSGIIHDKLRFVRWKRLVNMSDEVNKILDQRGVKDTRAVPPKLAIPLIEDASLEEEETLQKLWSRLLANAMDPNFNGELRFGFTEMIKNITGIEVGMLDLLYRSLLRENHLQAVAEVTNFSFEKQGLMNALGIDALTYMLSVNNLMRMQCIAPAVIRTSGIMFGNEPTTIFKGTDAVTLTPLGVKFIEACIRE